MRRLEWAGGHGWGGVLWCMAGKRQWGCMHSGVVSQVWGVLATPPIAAAQQWGIMGGRSLAIQQWPAARQAAGMVAGCCRCVQEGRQGGGRAARSSGFVHFFLAADLPLAAGLAAARLPALLAAGFLAGEVCSEAGTATAGGLQGGPEVCSAPAGKMLGAACTSIGLPHSPAQPSTAAPLAPCICSPSWQLPFWARLPPWPWRWRLPSWARLPSWWRWFSWVPAAGGMGGGK